MNRRIVIAVFSAFVVPLAPLWGQFRMAPRPSVPVRVNVGGGMSAARVARGPVAMRWTRAAPPPARRVATPRAVHSFRQVPSPNFIGTPCLTNPSYAGSLFCRSILRHRFFFGQPWFMPFYGYSPSYPEAEETPAAAPATAPDQEAYLAQQVERLSDEVEQLREEQASRQEPRPAAAVQPPSGSKPVPTVLVYRDGHHAEVQDYAIMGKTLWVFADETARKIPLAEFNLDATRKMNEERGVDFPTVDSL